MPSLSVSSGWVAVALIVLAASVPLSQRAFVHRRALPGSPPIRLHVFLGLATTAAALGHSLAVLPSLGSPSVVGAGMLAVAPAMLGFFLLFAHVGVGLQLREPKLKDRAKKRRLHVMLASGIALAVTAHIVALAYGG